MNGFEYPENINIWLSIFLEKMEIHSNNIKKIFIIMFMMSNVSVAQSNADNDSYTNQQNRTEIFNFGRPASEKEIAEWDLDVRPDGTGLPKGKGTVKKGEIIYAAKCGFCHGQKGEGGINDRLVARIGEEFPNEDQACGFQCRTIGNYWPYATTLFDYILRSMPMNAPGSLTNDEVYSLSAYLLYLNKIVSEEIELNSENLKNIVMPAHDKFVVDDRLDYLVAH